MNIEALVRQCKQITPKYKRLIIGVDGLGGSGKTKLAHAIQGTYADVSVIATDEFYKPLDQRGGQEALDETISQDFDWTRFGTVLQAVKSGDVIQYQGYDWKTGEPGQMRQIPADHWVIVEGIYATQKRFFDGYDRVIWIECPKKVRAQRIESRDGTQARIEWETKWAWKEDRYLERERPDVRAHIVIDGNFDIIRT